MNKTYVASLGLAAALAIGSSAAAEDGVPLDRYQPSFAADALFAAPDAAVKGDLRVSGRIDFSYAHAPLTVVERSSADSRELGRLVSHQAIAHYLLSLSLWDRLALDVDLPMTVSQSGEASARASLPDRKLDIGLNDLRLGARAELLEQSGLLPSAAVSGAVFLPTAENNGFSGAGTTRYSLGIDVGADYAHLLWRGFVTRDRNADGSSGLRALLGSGISFGAGVAWKRGALQVGPELFGARALGESSTYTPSKTNLELLLGAKYRLGLFVVGAAAGPGLTRAAGTPAYRILGSIAFSPEVAASSSTRPEPTEDTARATPGRDHTALAADLGAAPDRTVGAAKDSDGDAILDIDDHCPLVPGVASADPDRDGCPLDSDGDGIVDAEDACVNERGLEQSDPRLSGCPAAVRVEGSQIVILQQVSFATGSDTIEASSFELLAQVASVLSEHPEIARLAVDGHTDDVGAESKNLALSRRRAMSVARWLVEHGVDERRIEARGFGPRQPLDASKTPAARAKNRRVEFVIVKRSELGSSGWKDGPAE